MKALLYIPRLIASLLRKLAAVSRGVWSRVWARVLAQEQRTQHYLEPELAKENAELRAKLNAARNELHKVLRDYRFFHASYASEQALRRQGQVEKLIGELKWL